MERFLGAAGRFSSGRSDISANHDVYLAEDFGVSGFSRSSIAGTQ
jgi:hypothetical protein